MGIFFNIVITLFGFVLLIKGADYFIVSSASIAKKFNISPLIIGLTLVAFGTSLPELAVTFIAALSARTAGTTADIALGNVIGSNIANLTLILGFSAIMMPIAVKKSMNKQEFPFLIIITVLIAIVAFFFQADAVIVWWEALILLIAFAYYMYLMIHSHQEVPFEEEILLVKTKKAVILLLVGLVGVSVGGYLVTTGAEYIAMEVLVKAFSMTTTKAATLVGLSVVSLGTSLPELVTSVVAAKKGENEIALGNVVGSNVFNTLLIVGLAGIVTPLGVNGDVLIDTIVLIGITAFMILFSVTQQKISRFEGWLLVFMYFSYITYIIIRALGLF
ncbi:MAG: sodium:proton exchanger [Tenericutes bacterium HGW-Tenericutes-3]|nr:MAG: sodium:proton exchanger [Tenericutes bacterium HGW-Tenericutes-3]